VTDNARRADIVAVMGATGAGKSASIFAALAADPAPRLMIWDFKGEYLKFGFECVTRKALFDRLAAAGAGPFRLVFRPSFDVEVGRAQFNWFCKVAHAAGDVLVIADELHRVMLPNWSPAGWGLLVCLGRARGVRIIAASQRPAGIEKGFWDQATVIRSGRLNGDASARTVAGVLLVPWAEIVALPPLYWIQRSIYKPVIRRGRIEWRSGWPRDVLLSEKNLPAPGAG